MTNDEGGGIAGVGAPGGGRGSGGRGAAPNDLRKYTAWVKQTFGPRADDIARLCLARSDLEAV